MTIINYASSVKLLSYSSIQTLQQPLLGVIDRAQSVTQGREKPQQKSVWPLLHSFKAHL